MGCRCNPPEKFVPYEEYKKLDYENARLKAEVERLTLIVGADAIDREHGMCCDASPQVERLTKAGDAMWNALLCSGCSECMGMYDCHDEAMKLWNAAKKGGQS
jgi:hypothetical protein